MDGTAEQVQEKAKEYTAFLEEMASKGLSIGLIGFMEHIDSLNLLEKACFNANSFTIYPMSQEPLGSFTRNPVTSCSRHFRILVDEKGLIYPCIGLYGLEEFALGSIYTKMEDSYFGHQQYPLDLPALIAKGPTLIALTYQSFDSAHDDSTMTTCCSTSPLLSPFSPLSHPYQSPLQRAELRQ